MKMINIAGIISVILFYILILAVGMWAARKNTGGGDQEVRRSGPSLFVTNTNKQEKSIWVGKRTLGAT